MRAAEPSRVGAIDRGRFRRLLFDTPAAFDARHPRLPPGHGAVRGRELQREKLAALGQMSAGLAHELNNPAAAAKRSAAALGRRARRARRRDRPRSSSRASSARRPRQFVALKREAIERAQDGGRARRARRRRRRGRDRRAGSSATASPERVAAGRAARRGRARRGLARRRRGRDAGSALPSRSPGSPTTLTARALADDLRETTERMSTLVKAIKDYTYMDQAVLQEVDVHDGLEATLTILGHKLKHTRIEVAAPLRRRRCRASASTGPSSTRSGRTCSTTRSTRSASTGTIDDRHRAVARRRRRGADRRRRPGHPARTRSAASSSRSTPPSRSAPAPGSASTRRGGSCATATTATCSSGPARARRCSPCGCRARRARA